ncbi:MAG: hypothetical protein KDA45_15090 [Planctomycetales bacterium]|nr:hypothetical protein [Planctomycetales bacterium]
MGVPMLVNVNIQVPLARLCETDFFVPILADVVAPGVFSSKEKREQAPTEYIVGRVFAQRMDWLLAKTMGYNPLAVCDAASSTWLQLYETLSNKRRNGFRKDLNLDTFIRELFFVQEILLHPDIEDRLAVLDAVLSGMSGDNSLILMQHEPVAEHHLHGWELRDLGFKKIARSNFLLRDNRFRYPFGEAHYGGRSVDFAATAEHEEWLLDHWDSLISHSPSP